MAHEQHLDSSSSSSTHSDDALKLFASAPWWLYCTSWKLAKPENVGTESCTFKVTGPVSSDEMMQLYRAKKLKGSVLMVGLTQAAKDMRPGQDLPASVYRTLAHLFEMSRNGVPYTPVDCDGLKNGMSAASWARPLWTICEPSLPSSPGVKADEEDEDEPTQGSAQGEVADDGKDSEDQAEEEGEDSASEGHKFSPNDEVSLAVRLLKSAPSWCYLYSHEPLKSKKTPPKTSAHMVDMYKSGCLPEWTPLLGLRQNVAHFNSLPPSLFTTLGALLTVLQAGLELQPVGLVELQRYDKFIECRNHVGSTMRAPSSDSLHGTSSGTLVFNRRALSGAQSVPLEGHNNTKGNSTPNGKNSGKTGASASANNQHTSSGQISSPSHGAWAATSSTTPVGSESPGTPVQSSYSTAENPIIPPYGMPIQQHMHLYQAMLPTWLWGMPHMPYTFLAAPGAAGAAPGHPMNSLPSSAQPAATGSPARRNSGKQRSGAGRGGTASTPGSPATANNPTAITAPVSSPGSTGPTNAHRLAQSSTVGLPGSTGSMGGARHSIVSPGTNTIPPVLSSPPGSLLVAPGVPAPPHPLLMPPGVMPPDGAAAAAAAMQAGLWGWPGAIPPTAASPAASGGAAPPSSSPWQTSLFRLFMADCSRGMDVPVWWYLENKTSGPVVGPLGCEAMIMAFARGALTEQHMVCGTHSDVTAASPPAREFFEELGGLLRQVEAGGSYVLVSLAEVTRHASLAVFSTSGSGGSMGGASNGRQSKAGKKGSKAGTLQSMGSAPIPPRTPTSTQATSPRHEASTDITSTMPPPTMESWTSSPGLPKSSPGTGRAKNSARQANLPLNGTSPTRATAATQVDTSVIIADASATITTPPASVAAQATPSGVDVLDADAEAARFRGLAVHVPAARDAAAAAAAATAEWVESHDTAFTSREAVQAAAAAASMAMSPNPQVVVVQSDVDLRGRSGGGLGSADLGTPRTIVTLGSGMQVAPVQQLLMPSGESGRLSCCSPGVRDQLRKSSRGGAPLSVKDSLDDDQVKNLAPLCSGELRDSDDDVRGPAARDAHDSRNCSVGGGVNGQMAAATVAAVDAVVATEVPITLG